MRNEPSKIRLDCYFWKRVFPKYIKCLHCFSPKKWRNRILKSLFFCLLIMTVLRPTIWILTFFMRNEPSEIRPDCYFWKQVFQKYMKCLRCFSPEKWRNRILKLLFFCLLAMTVFSTYLSVSSVYGIYIFDGWSKLVGFLAKTK